MNDEYTLQHDIEERLTSMGFKKAWDESEIEYLVAKKLIEIQQKRDVSQ